MRISIVTTLYLSEGQVLEFYHQALHVAKLIHSQLELIFVNDDSPDGSLRLARELTDSDECVRVIDLSRTFGQDQALLTGLGHTTGELIFMVDCYAGSGLGVLPEFYKTLIQEMADVVYGIVPSQESSRARRLSTRLLKLFFGGPAKQMTTVRLMSARYLTSLLEHRDREVCLAGLWNLVGYKQVGVPVSPSPNQRSRWNAGNIAGRVAGLIGFSIRPLATVFYLGCGILTMALVGAFYLVVDRLYFRTLLSGWPSLVVSVWLLGGLTLFCLGLLGAYVGKILSETKDRPYTTIRHIYSSRTKEGQDV